MLNVKPLLPDFAVAGFSAPAAGVLSFCSMFVVVVTGATVAGGLLLLVALLAKGAAAGCLGVTVTVVLLGVGLCTVDAAAGLGVGLGATAGKLEVTGLAGLGSAALTTGGLLATGVADWMVVDTTLGTACFSCFTTGGGFGDGTAGWATGLAAGLDGVGVALDVCPADFVLLVL